jgi:hypothetical protein
MFRHEIAEVPLFHTQRDVLSNEILRSESLGYGLKIYSGFHFLLTTYIKPHLLWQLIVIQVAKKYIKIHNHENDHFLRCDSI